MTLGVEGHPDPCVGLEPGASTEESQAGTKSEEALVSSRVVGLPRCLSCLTIASAPALGPTLQTRVQRPKVGRWEGAGLQTAFLGQPPTSLESYLRPASGGGVVLAGLAFPGLRGDPPPSPPPGIPPAPTPPPGGPTLSSRGILPPRGAHPTSFPGGILLPGGLTSTHAGGF